MIDIRKDEASPATGPEPPAVPREPLGRGRTPERKAPPTAEAESAGQAAGATQRLAELRERLARLPGVPGRELAIRVEPGSHRIVIEVRDAETKDVVRQIPPEEKLALLRELAPGPGTLVDREG